MFYCRNCGFEFEKPENIYENHGMLSPPFEKISVCPNCRSDRIFQKNITHCRCCGARLPKGIHDYCSEWCREKGEKLYALERKRRRITEQSPVCEIIKQLKKYNTEHGTDLSYGQFVAFVLSKKKDMKKCKTRKKNI